MKYVVLVSHGRFAEGLADALSMLAGKREDVKSVGLYDGKTADQFADEFQSLVTDITRDDEIILLADIIGGSPLTTAMNVLSSMGYMNNTVVIGGMNLPLALSIVLMKELIPLESLPKQALSEAMEALKEFKVSCDEEDDI